MANGKIKFGKQSGGTLGLVFPDGVSDTEVVLPESGTVVTTAEVAVVQSQVDTHMSVPTSYHIYNGGVSIDNTVITNGFATTLHTGNGTTQSINTGVDMSTQWGNDVSETFGGLVWLKSRSIVGSHYFGDTIRGSTWNISSDSTTNQLNNTTGLTSIGSSGFNVGSLAAFNQNGSTYVSWNFQTTHRRTGVTNHGKAFTEHYNPFTGFTIIKYEGSGLAGHEIPHSLGRKLGIILIKDLSAAINWWVNTDNGYTFLNTTDSNTIFINESNDNSIVLNSTTGFRNTSANQYILYGWANSYYDKNNTLIGNYEVGVYQGTGAAGNKVTTRGKPAWLMFKRLDNTGSWLIVDNQRGTNPTKTLFPNLSNAEDSPTPSNYTQFNIDGFNVNGTGTGINAAGGQYLYMVVYDNDSGSGKSKYPKATDTTNVNINALVPYANGIDTAGSKVSISYKNQTISGLTLTQGKNYLYSKNDGTYGVNKYMPMYGALRDRVVAGENPDYFDLKTQKWYATTGGAELATNGTFDSNTTGWTAQNGATISVVNGTLNIVRGTGNYAVSQTISGLTIGRKYRILIGTLNNLAIYIANNTNTQNYASITASNSYVDVIPYETSIVIQGHVSSGTGNVDNVSTFDLTPIIGAEITPRTYLDCIVYADNNGQIEYIEELPKTVYFDEVKANEYKGKNSVSLWCSLDCTTTPVTIKDSYNVASIIRVGTGLYDIYFKENMDNVNYSIFGTGYSPGDGYSRSVMRRNGTVPLLNKVSIIHSTGNAGSPQDAAYIDIQILGGKNA